MFLLLVYFVLVLTAVAIALLEWCEPDDARACFCCWFILFLSLLLSLYSLAGDVSLMTMRHGVAAAVAIALLVL